MPGCLAHPLHGEAAAGLLGTKQIEALTAQGARPHRDQHPHPAGHQRRSYPGHCRQSCQPRGGHHGPFAAGAREGLGVCGPAAARPAASDRIWLIFCTGRSRNGAVKQRLPKEAAPPGGAQCPRLKRPVQNREAGGESVRNSVNHGLFCAIFTSPSCTPRRFSE
jgi:hypothetical protein